jgi:hypothetical protein
VRLYINGTQQASGARTSSVIYVTNGPLIGSVAGNQYAGVLDEVRVSNTARPADWITAEYNMEKPSQTMVTVGSRTALGGPRGAQIVELPKRSHPVLSKGLWTGRQALAFYLAKVLNSLQHLPPALRLVADESDLHAHDSVQQSGLTGAGPD